jgi:hypothetical protein
MRYTDEFINDLRDRLPISDVVGTRVTWDRKKTSIQRGDYWACCPFHGEGRPSFHCEDRKGRYHCFGCGVDGDQFRFLMELDGISFPRAVEMVASLAGVGLPGHTETEAEKRERNRRAADRQRRDAQRQQDDERERERKIDTVRSLWDEAKPIAGTLAETYLRSRFIELESWPASLRFHPRLSYAGGRHPALIGGVQAASRKLIAIWRVFLNADGTAMKDEEGKKVKLGFGPATGGAVRFGPVTETLRLAEGMETALAVMLLTKPNASTWATLSTSGMTGLEIPAGVKRLELYADGDRHRLNKRTGGVEDPPGIKAANTLKERAMKSGLEVAVFPSPEPDDWLDVLEARVKDQRKERPVFYQEG